jgi:AraC-like DNA-binding protein
VPVPTIASGAIRKLLLGLEERSIDPAPFLAEAGIDPAVVADQDGRVPIAALHALWEAAIRVAPVDEGAVLGAARYAPGDYGLVGFVAMNSATLDEAIRHVVRYAGLWTDEPGMELGDDGTLTVAYRTPFEDRLGVRCATEAAPAEILNGARVLTQKRIVPREVRFTHAAPDDTRSREAFFGCPLSYGAPDNAMQLEPADLALPLPKADAQLGAYLRSVANQALAHRGGAADSLLERLRQIIAEELQKGVPTADQVARRLATSERTLRRRLEQDGTSFRALLDKTRAELADSYVRDKRLPLSEVAFLVGFSEPSAFYRAFKRWTDSTPKAWRARS